MGLLDGLPSNLLDLLQNSALNQNLNAGIGADAANYPTPASLPQQAPLSLAGPGFSGGASSAPNGVPTATDFSSSNRMPAAPLALAPPPTAAPPQPGAPGIGDRLSAGFQSWARTPLGNPWLGMANGIQGLSSGQRVDPEGQRQALFAQATQPGSAPSGNTSGGIDYDKLQRSLLASGDLDGAKTVSDIAGKNSTDLIRNYAYAKSQGFPGSILDYGKATRAAGTTGVRNNPSVNPARPAAGAPAPGSIMNGHRFKGGNAWDRNNWEPL